MSSTAASFVSFIYSICPCRRHPKPHLHFVSQLVWHLHPVWTIFIKFDVVHPQSLMTMTELKSSESCPSSWPGQWHLLSLNSKKIIFWVGSEGFTALHSEFYIMVLLQDPHKQEVWANIVYCSEDGLILWLVISGCLFLEIECIIQIWKIMNFYYEKSAWKQLKQ